MDIAVSILSTCKKLAETDSCWSFSGVSRAATFQSWLWLFWVCCLCLPSSFNSILPWFLGAPILLAVFLFHFPFVLLLPLLNSLNGPLSHISVAAGHPSDSGSDRISGKCCNLLKNWALSISWLFFLYLVFLYESCNFVVCELTFSFWDFYLSWWRTGAVFPTTGTWWLLLKYTLVQNDFCSSAHSSPSLCFSSVTGVFVLGQYFAAKKQPVVTCSLMVDL